MANQESKKLGCPKCVGILETEEIKEMEETPVYIDRCAMCKGIWFDEGELQKYLKSELIIDDDDPTTEYRKDWEGDMLDLKKAKCPRCKTEMSRLKSAQDSRVITDYCLECGGSWLDGGEIRLLLRGGPVKRAINYVIRKMKEKIDENFENRRGHGTAS